MPIMIWDENLELGIAQFDEHHIMKKDIEYRHWVGRLLHAA